MSYTLTPLSQTDGYKLSHKGFMHPKTTKLYANMTARSGKYMTWQDHNQRVVVFGIQGFVKNVLIKEFNEQFFNLPKAEAVGRFKARVDAYLGEGAIPMKHFEALHKLGYLPLEIKAVPEGTKIPLRVAQMTWTNTHKDFAWLVTYIETVLSQEIWPATTAATVAYQFLTLFNRFADETVGNRLHVPFQGHDFSARGLMGRYAAGALVGPAHLLSFAGTDTVAALDYVDQVYGGYPAGSLIGCSVPASEHSVTSLGIAVDGELETIKRWITECYPTGIVSVVSDTIDYWKVVTEYLPALEKEIRARKPNGFLPGKVVVRPDSGDPVRVVAGYREDEVYRSKVFVDMGDGTHVRAQDSITVRETGEVITENEFKGSIQVLYELFGGTINKFGYKELDPCIGLIYGDSITIRRAEEIFSRLQQKGFASNNVVFGIGSFTYQMNSRDTLGMAIKATYAEVDGKPLELYKDPKTDDGTKRSAKGLISVHAGSSGIQQFDQCSWAEEELGLLRTVFRDGKLLVDENFVTIRNRVQDIKEVE